MLNEIRDTTILYQGGSGGFFLFYLLLLSGDYCCGIPGLENSATVDETWNVIKQQFPLSLKSNQSEWKRSESWPDNYQLKKIRTAKKKLYLICNPLFCSDMLEQHRNIMEQTQIVLLYTDLSTQLRLAYEKNAYWFTDVSKKYFQAPDDSIEYLKKIRRDFVYFRNETVDPMTEKIIKSFNPDIILKLQDIITDESLNVTQRKFIDYWLSLQTRKGLNKIYYNRRLTHRLN